MPAAMQFSGTALARKTAPAPHQRVVECAVAWAGVVAQRLATSVAVVDAQTGEVLCGQQDQPSRDWSVRSELCREVSRRGRAEVIEECDVAYVVAAPCETPTANLVLVTTRLARRPTDDRDWECLAEFLGVDRSGAWEWCEGQVPCGIPAALQLVELALACAESDRRVQRLEEEAEILSVRIASTYEGITLLYRLTQHLRLSQSDEDLGRMALESLAEVVPAEGLALQLVPVQRAEGSEPVGRSGSTLLSWGKCPLDAGDFSQLVDKLKLRVGDSPFVANRSVTSQATWRFAEIRELVVVPLVEGENVFGWLAAFNHAHHGEFGTHEAQLMHSVATILGIHSGNIELYRQQAELLSGVIRALSSAIDAKDPYTCGHSDRVARVAVRLGEKLGWGPGQLQTLYLAGLLHDIGKIGIDDNVLRKPGKLTAAEYEHIKTHVEIGYNILVDLKQLGHVLPGVRHHHESWDGNGYPDGLKGEKIPELARILAVADSFDAMSSDRPYRKGMSDEKLDAILRQGAGQQWDARVVRAFFDVRDDVRRISHRDTDGVDPEVPQWVDLALHEAAESSEAAPQVNLAPWPA